MITSAEEFERLCSGEYHDEYTRRQQEEAPVDVWLEIVVKYPELRFNVAHNKSVPIEILALLSTDPDSRVRSMVADKRKLTPEILTQMATDSDDAVRMSVARHKHTPLEVLRSLAENDPWDKVRQHAAERL